MRAILLDGSFRLENGRTKLKVKLVDATTDSLVWSDRIVRPLDELVDLEEEVAAQVAATVEPELEAAEARRVLRRPAEDLNAWELAMRASWMIANSGAGYAEAERLASRAAERAPDWVVPYTLIAIARFQQAMANFSSADSAQAFASTLDVARQALEIDRSAWIAHALAAVGELWTNQNHERALLHVRRAIDLNPSASMNYHFGGCITGFFGDPETARSYQERLFRIDPVYTFRAEIEADLGLWHLLDAHMPEAEAHLQRA